jgi:hypothetical protein
MRDTYKQDYLAQAERYTNSGFGQFDELIDEARVCERRLTHVQSRLLSELLPADAAARRACADLFKETVAATGKLNADGQCRLNKVSLARKLPFSKASTLPARASATAVAAAMRRFACGWRR